MPGSTLVDAAPKFRASTAVETSTLVQRPRFVRSRPIEKEPPKHGEKPYEELVAAAFDGPVLRLSQKMKLLEEADNRKIRRGDAIDLIEAMRREMRAKYAVKKPSAMQIFVKQYAVFVACYMAFALVWCVVLTRANGAGGAAEVTAAAIAAPADRSQVYATSVNPPLDQQQR